MHQIEAIVLHSILFKEYDRILTLFSPQGLLKLFAKGAKGHSFHLAALTSPLTFAEFSYVQGKKDLHRLSEGSILCQNVRIRERYETLLCAEKMIQALLQSQWIGKPAPKLFELFSLFIAKLPEAKDPSTLGMAFLLKVLRHEGVLQLSAPFTETLRFAGERYQKSDAPEGALLFSEEEEELLAALTLSRSFSQLTSYNFSSEFQKKIDILFSQTFN